MTSRGTDEKRRKEKARRAGVGAGREGGSHLPDWSHRTAPRFLTAQVSTKVPGLGS